MAAPFPLSVFVTGAQLLAAQLNNLVTALNTINPTAKGSLFGASTVGTPRELLVGADGSILQADSTNVAGVSWLPGVGGAWTAYTPTVTAQTGIFTTISATGRYKLFGKTCFVQIVISITTVGTATGSLNFTLPVTAGAASYAAGVSRENAVNGIMGQLYITPNSTTGAIAKYDGTTQIVAGASILGSVTYETA